MRLRKPVSGSPTKIRRRWRSFKAHSKAAHKSQLTGTGLSQNLTPAVVLSAAHRKGGCDRTLDAPYGLAVDGEGDLFVTNVGVHGGCRGSLAEFSAGSIESSGSPKPKVFVTTDGKHNSIDAPNALTFGPGL